MSDGTAAGCSSDRRAGALLVGGIGFWAMVLLQDAVVITVLVLPWLEASLCWAILLLQDAVVIVALVISLVVASAWWSMVAAAGRSSNRHAGALLGGGIGLVSDSCCCWMQW